MGGTPPGAGAESSCEGVAEMKHHGLITTPIPHASAPIGGRMYKTVDGGGRFFSFSFSLLCLLLAIGNKLNELPYAVCL